MEDNQKPLYQRIAHLLNAVSNCERSSNAEWKEKHSDRINELVKEHMPSGSGFDNGTELDWDRSTDEKLVFNTSFHHMDEHGYYDGWTEHTVIVTPSLSWGLSLRITGRDRNDIKEMIHEQFSYALTTLVRM